MTYYTNNYKSIYTKNKFKPTNSSNNGTSAYKTFKDKNSDDDLDEEKADKFLGYFTHTKESTCLTIPIDEPIREAAYYRQIVQAIGNTGEDDQIDFEISSPGGRLDGLLVLLTAMAKTEATTVAYINSDCHSAASMLALNCDSIYVSPYASMLVHFVSFGTAGKATDIKSHVNHVHSTSELLFRETYELFLTEDEIDKCIGGFELWLDSEEINRRLTIRFDAIQKMREDAQKLQELAKDKIAIESGCSAGNGCATCVTESEKPKKTTKSKPKVDDQVIS